MTILTLGLLLLGLGFFFIRVGGTGVPRGAERVYLGLAPMPALLTLVAPAAIGFARGFDSGSRA